MTEQKSPIWNLLNERSIIVTIIAVMALLWAFDQINTLATVISGGVTTLLLIQLEVKRRLEHLERRRIEAQEKRINRRKGIKSLRASALNNLPSPILMVDDTNVISFANDAARELLGEQIVSDDVFLYLRQSSFVNALGEVLEGKSVQTGAIRYTNSQDRSFDLTISPVSGKKTDGSKRLQAMVFFFEVTSLLRTEQMRVDFVANASHELRTPLTTITGFIETLLGPAADDPDAQKRFLQIMQRESDRMKRLIDDLLSLSRIEMSRHDIPDEEIDVNSLIKATANACEPAAAERGISMSLELDEDNARIIGDSDQLTQVFINLLGNAAKYADRDTTVHVVTNIDPLASDYLLVTIRDEGPGISAEHLGRLTERFYRVDTARSRKMGGTGLGLAIVKHILLRHSAQLEIKSQIGAGTSFSFKLPTA